MSTCLTAGSSEPTAFYVGLINTSMGRSVRQAVISRFDVRTFGASAKVSDEALFNDFITGQSSGIELQRLFKTGKLTKAQIMSTSFFKNYLTSSTGAPSGISKDELLDKIVAVYLQWTLVQVWNNRSDVTPEEIMADECLEKAVFTVAPASVDVAGPRGPVKDLPGSVWPWVLGGVFVAGVVVYFVARKKKPATTPALATALGAT